MAVLVAAGFVPKAGQAVPPACFPERTVMVSAQVRDEQGRVFAGVRAGHMVRVIDDYVGKDFDEALIEIDEPIRYRGFVYRVLLHAFPRHQIEILPAKRWWLTGLPLNVHQGDGKKARVTRAELHDALSFGEGSRIHHPTKLIACSELDGRPPKIKRRSDCYGAMSASPDRPKGRSMQWQNREPVLREVPPDDDSEDPTLILIERGYKDYYLISRSGKRALVDAWDWSGERTRGWVEARLLRPGPPMEARTFITECKCCPAEVYVPLGKATALVELGIDTPVRASPDGPVISLLKKGARFPLLARLDRQARVLIENRKQPIATSLFYGWVDWDALVSPPAVGPGTRGQLIMPQYMETGSPITDVRIGERIDLVRAPLFEVEGRMLSATEFLLPNVTIATYMDAPPFIEDRDGFPLCSPWDDLNLNRLQKEGGQLRCGSKARPFHSVRLSTNDGLGIPNARAGGTFGLRNEWGGYGFHLLRTARDGHVRIPQVERENTSFGFHASGFQNIKVDSKQPIGVILHLSAERERVIAGSVARNHQQCTATEVVPDHGFSSSGSDVTEDCRFSMTASDEPGTLAWDGEGPGSLKIGKGDLLDLCLGKSCDKSALRAWLFVRVANDDDNLVATARVRASIAGVEVGACLAPAGACFIHDIPTGQEVLLEATSPQGNGQAAITPKPGVVTQVTVPL